MTQADRLKTQLEKVRSITEGMLQAFQTPEQWTYQVQPNTNHAMWCAGHMITSDNYFLSVLAPEKTVKLEGYREMFGMGSKPSSDPADYPSTDEVLGHMRERRETLLSVLSSMSDEDLAKATPDGAPEMFADIASIFELTIWHEAMHMGQVSVARRALGNDPLMSQPAPAAKA